MPEITFEGGLNEQDDTRVKPQECTEGYNFELGDLNSHFKPRKPFDYIATATTATSVGINGIIQLIKTDDSETTLVQNADNVYNWDGASAFTSVGTCDASSKLRGATWTLGNYSVISDLAKLTVMKKWDGTTFTDLTHGITSTSLYAKYALVHLGRMWLFNVKAGSDTPHMMVASAYEDPESYNVTLRATDSSFSTGNEAFFMLTPNLKPINGVALFYDTLIVSTEDGVIYKITGTDSTNFALTPMYSGSAAIGTETMVNIGNDVVYMRRGGHIESLSSTDRYGDVSTDDLSRYIRTQTKELTDGIFVYDQTRQRVYCFCGANKLLVLYKDMMGTDLSPWSHYKTNHTSEFNPNYAGYIRDPNGTDWYVYFGDSSGNIYRLDGTGNGDNGDTDIATYRRTALIEHERADSSLYSVSGRVHYKRAANNELSMTFEWSDDYSRSLCIVPLEGPETTDSGAYFGGEVYFGGEFYFNTGFSVTQRISTKGYSPVGIGPGFYLELYVEDNQTFDILKITDES